ncbi:dethiobiotin synthase [Moraxella nasovis]|uniref:dethiobiotin synthase n=1 Tax=Moraxella nasovis TaxID=2904121 RepID=UPI001F618275|nr:dethiobiotin synthase [Moraxella nasovis]UNU74013.1 dethiobiotin synthase [Moraxella nasovis]
MSVYFITGIDTDIGKTYATGVLAREFIKLGKSVITQKLVQTGVTGQVADDIITHRQLMGISLQDTDTDGTTCPMMFAKPASPHLSARLENKTIDTAIITKATQRLQSHYDIVLLEGAGGVLVPMSDELLTLDHIAHCGYPVIIVTSARLGSINHTLLSLEAIANRGLDVAGVVFNHYFDGDDDISADTLNYLKNHVARHYPSALFMELMGDKIVGFGDMADRF